MSWDLFDAADPDRTLELVDSIGRGARALGAAGEAASTGTEYTPSAVNALARELLESAFPPLWVVGEVGSWTRASSGHCYFTLRDADAQLRCVMFRGDARRLPADPDEGMEVRALGELTIYERRGGFQLIVRELDARGGDGLWRIAFERLKEKLDGEGLTAADRKRPLPDHPARVGVITSPVGAALQDVLNGLERRAPWTRVVFSAARVQGDGAAEEIAAAVRRFAAADAADVLIVGRGGGSVEDLWAFNEEPVARAIAECPIPVISAVGHEVDVTIADLVADARAPTPSAAAEYAVPDRRGVLRELDELVARMERASRTAIAERRGEVLVHARALDRAVRTLAGARADRLARIAGRLDALSPLAALRRGYAVPLDEDGRILRSVRDFDADEPFRLRVVDGRVDCRVEGVDVEDGQEASNGGE